MADPTAPIKQMRQTLDRATRSALEDSFRYWHTTFAPQHFRRAAFSRYPLSYAESAKRDQVAYRERHAEQIDARRQTADPLRKSGRFEQAFLSGSYRFGAASKFLHVTWPNLPRHVRLRNPYSGFSVVEAITDVPEHERREMQKIFVAALGQFMEQKFARRKSYGRWVTDTGD